jgi:hypothetical protein
MNARFLSGASLATALALSALGAQASPPPKPKLVLRNSSGKCIAFTAWAKNYLCDSPSCLKPGATFEASSDYGAFDVRLKGKEYQYDLVCVGDFLSSWKNGEQKTYGCNEGASVPDWARVRYSASGGVYTAEILEVSPVMDAGAAGYYCCR